MHFPVVSITQFDKKCDAFPVVRPGLVFRLRSNHCCLHFLWKHGSTEDNSEVVTDPAKVLHRDLSSQSSPNTLFSAVQTVSSVCNESEKHRRGQQRCIHSIYRGGGGRWWRFYWWQRGGGAVSASGHCRRRTGSPQAVHRPPWRQMGKQEAVPDHRWGVGSLQVCPDLPTWQCKTHSLVNASIAWHKTNKVKQGGTL